MPITTATPRMSRILIRIGRLLDEWLDKQPVPRGTVVGGEVGCRIQRDPDITVGIDVAYISAEVAQRESEETTLIEGAPTLAVEIPSPSDTQEAIDEKVDAYINAGTALVWVVDPHDRTVLIYQPGQEPTLVNSRQEISADPVLPGFRVHVAEFFR